MRKETDSKTKQDKQKFTDTSSYLSIKIVDFTIASHLCRLGRRGAMMAGAVMFAFSYLLLVLAPNVWFVYIGR